MSIPEKLSALRYVAPLAFLGLAYTAIVVLIKAPENISQSTGHAALAILDWNIFKVMSICLFAFNCHINVVPVAAEMQGLCDRRIRKINVLGVLVQLIFYSLLAVGGYLSFLDNTQQDLLEDYDAKDTAVLASRCLLPLTIIVGIPTNNGPTVQSLMNVLRAFSSTRGVGSNSCLHLTAPVSSPHVPGCGCC